ncbi:MAG: hydroxysqualene dehydroxylase HpnE [Planctomycetota bacterium]|nr:hydroxysqualene dehydroxylase HpnE [Planctomycetota bacterium]
MLDGTPKMKPVLTRRSPAGSASQAIVVGGGLAGIACAVGLADRGVRVLLLEARRRLGGRASSFIDASSGEALDNCQHVTLGCCRAYLSLLRRLGADSLLRWTTTQTWIEPGGRRSVLRPSLLPPPLHFAPSFLGARFLSMADKLSIAHALRGIMLAERSEHEQETFAAFLSRCDATPGAIERFWSPVVVSACNSAVEHVSASSALHVFQEGFLWSRGASAVGVPSVPLQALYQRVPEILQESGGGVVLGASAESLDERCVRLRDGTELTAGVVVCALPFEQVGRVMDRRSLPELAVQRLTDVGRLEHRPILGVHLAFDRPVLDVPHAVLPASETQWLFRKSPAGDRVHAVISDARAWMDLGEPRILERVAGDIRECLPAARGAMLVWGRAVKERLATFAPLPGSQRLRPPADLGPGVPVLAGDYADTGWPATMEGATRSGLSAAQVACARLRSSTR